jgi:NAD(P)-dependent dehydrogenase (short-subunit alcohol dehydrogenase family)
MLKDKTVFVSGGTGYLGRAISEACADYNARVIFSYYKNEKSALEMMDKIKGSRGIPINVKDVRDIKEKIKNLYQEIDVVDILINNAGISQVMPLPMLEEDDFDLLVDVNVKGTVFLTKAIVMKMIRQKKGSIVNIGSIAGHRLLDVPVHYALTKGAVSGFTCALAVELKRFNIRVNSVVPGLLEDGVARVVPEDGREDYIEHCAVSRLGTGREVAEVVCFIASDRASYVNGQNIVVDGGI